MSTHVHVGGKEQDGSRLKVVGNDNLGILAIVILADSDFGCGKFDQFGWDTAVSLGVVFPLIKVGLDGRSTEVGDLCSTELRGLDYHRH